MISLSFQKIETKNLNRNPSFSISLVLEILHHQLHIIYLNIRSDHEIEAALVDFSKNVSKVSKMYQNRTHSFQKILFYLLQ